MLSFCPQHLFKLIKLLSLLPFYFYWCKMGSYESHSLFWVVCVGVVVTDDDVRDGDSWAITAILIPFPQ